MNGAAIALVVASGTLHAIWNLLTKRSKSQMAFLWLAQLVAIVVFVPLALIVELDKYPDPGIIPLVYLLLSMVLHGGYMVLLANAYKVGDLSVVYPIMRGTSPVLVPVLGVTFLHDHLSRLDICGIFLIAAGIFLLGKRKPSTDGGSHKNAVLLALAVGLAITAYTFIDKLALTYGGIPPLSLNAASNVGNGLFLTWFALKENRIRQEWTGSKPYWILGGLFASGGYTLFLIAMSMASIAQLAPMREIGTVIGTLLGVFILRESQGPARIAASCCITMGVVAIGWQSV